MGEGDKNKQKEKAGGGTTKNTKVEKKLGEK